MRKSTVTTHTDSAGPYEVEVFEAEQPKSIIVCSHGNGVRRWDGEHFFHHLADHYPDHTFLLVDQNQPIEDGGCKLNSLDIMVSRVQGLITKAAQDYPGVPVTIVAHSMGCGVTSQLDLSDVGKVIFVAPAAGSLIPKLIKLYGPEVLKGQVVKTSDGLIKDITREYLDSTKDIIWEKEYEKLLQHYKNVHVFESGDEEIVTNDRFQHRDMPFASHKIIPGAKHNYAGEALQKLFTELDTLLPN